MPDVAYFVKKMLRNSNVPLQCISKYLLAGQHGQTVSEALFLYMRQSIQDST